MTQQTGITLPVEIIARRQQTDTDDEEDIDDLRGDCCNEFYY